MKLIMVVASLGIGGTEQKVIRLANYFSSMGKVTEILSLSRFNSDKIHLNSEVGFNVIDTNCSIISRFLARKKFKEYMLSQYLRSGSIVVFYFNYYPALFLFKSNFRQFVFVNSTHANSFLERIKRECSLVRMRHASGIILGNNSLKKNYLGNKRFENIHIDVINNGVDLHCRKKDDYRFRSVFRIAIVARLRIEKRHSDIFKALKILEYRGFDVALDCIGSEVLKGWEKKLKQEVDNLGLLRKVNFRGEISNVKELIATYDAFVLPSNDTFSNALLEAMNAGCPVVAANIGGSMEIIDHMIDGLLFEYGSVSDLARKIEMLIVDEDMRRNLGSRAAIKISKSYSSEMMFQKYESYL